MAKFNLEPSGSFHQMVRAIVTVLAVINPVVCGSIFLMLTRQLDLIVASMGTQFVLKGLKAFLSV